MKSQAAAQPAFTVMEVLVVMILISMMGAMVVTAVQGVTETARESRTKSIIATIDNVLMEHYESYKYRALAIDIPDMYQATPVGNTVGYEVLATEAARVRLMMIRDLMRMELPDRLTDIRDAPSLLLAAANPVVQNATGQIIGTREDLTVRRTFPVRWFDESSVFGSVPIRDNVPSRLAAYRSRIPTGFNFTAEASLQNQGAECLYLIMATSFIGGVPAIDSIPPSNIGDTDGDGLPEILDGWGRPLGFIRWPVGFFDTELSINTGVPDDFDLFRSDYAFLDQSAPPTSPAVPTDVNTGPAFKIYPWSLRPLVFSAGPDGSFGIATNPWTAAIEVADFSYRSPTWHWPLTAAYYGTQLPGRATGVAAPLNTAQPFPDPYLRVFVANNQNSGAFAGLLPGQLLSTPRAASEAADNITNYQLQVAPR